MGSDRHFARQPSSGLNVRFGSKADISHCNRHVRFTPKSGHTLPTTREPPRLEICHRLFVALASTSRGPATGTAQLYHFGCVFSSFGIAVFDTARYECGPIFLLAPL